MARDTVPVAWSHNRMSSLDHPAVAKVTAVLAESGQQAAADGVRVLPAEVRTADGEETALLALTSGAHRADPSRLAELSGLTDVGKADAAFVREHTGQPIGGVAPVGHPAKLVTLVDTALRAYDVVWAAAGHPKSVFPTTFDGLAELTGATAGALAGEEKDDRS